ncbi:hypothetical protein MH120_16110 [Bacillus altitudinis]|nr:hypothetical protein [Bacillus altitudinis]MCY7622999.1 hypothetical protein [Bacillus altitudinis]MDI6559128.1 hypothetical protein [Bacillus altitudinis]WEZ70868.1 hypothetical protein P5623_17325 [Bacillus altitudinis]
MNRRYTMVLVIVSVLLIVSACGKPSFKKEAAAFGENYKKAQYTVNRTDDLSDMKEKLKDYLTEHEYQEYTQDSMFSSVLEAAKDQDCQIKLKKITFTPSDESDDRIEFDYEMIIQFIDHKGKVKKEIEKKGAMTVIKTDSGLKISRDWDGRLYPSDYQSSLKSRS